MAVFVSKIQMDSKIHEKNWWAGEIASVPRFAQIGKAGVFPTKSRKSFSPVIN
jgi:hypothetical protein